MVKNVFGQMRVIEKIAASQMKLIPENLVIGGAGGNSDGGSISAFFGFSLLEKVTGRPLAVGYVGNKKKFLAVESLGMDVGKIGISLEFPWYTPCASL